MVFQRSFAFISFHSFGNCSAPCQCIYILVHSTYLSDVKTCIRLLLILFFFFFFFFHLVCVCVFLDFELMLLVFMKWSLFFPVNVMSRYFLSLSSTPFFLFGNIKYCSNINRTRNQAQHYHFVVLYARYVIILTIFSACFLFFSFFLLLLVPSTPLLSWYKCCQCQRNDIFTTKIISKHIIVKMICKWNICSY